MRETRREAVVHGVIAGVIGYAVVVLLLALYSLLAGRSPLEIPSALGSALLAVGTSPPGSVDAGAVLAINGVHLLASLAVGLCVAWLLYEVEVHHELWYVSLLVFVSGFLFILLGTGVLAVEIAGVLSWTQIFVTTVAWALALAGYLSRFHRGLAQEIDAEQLQTSG